ncbi:MAG: TrkA family potassium uptake protein [Eubacteriales bacterium SKADARSKE-1]|nr:TrkA family potassium uptake protein [Eubacteriales bacterium SKADARSKE-1]
MKIVIIGGGKLGYYIAEAMLDRDYEVKLIEKDRARCNQLAELLDAEVIHGDGTEIEILSDAMSGKVECLIAVTGRDQDNLVAAQLAAKRFQVKKVIARANNPRNLEALRKLGITHVVSSTEIITKLIEQEVESASGRLVATLNRGRAAICELLVTKNSKVAGVSLKDIILPKFSLIISILRNDELLIPQGDTVFTAGDEVVAICMGDSQRKLIKLFENK